MINEKKREYKQATTNKFSSYQQPKPVMSRPTFDLAEHDVASNKRFAQLMNELDQAKLDILALKEQSLKQQSLAHTRAPQDKHHSNLAQLQQEIQSSKK